MDDNADSRKTEENGGCGKGCLFVCGVLLFGLYLMLYALGIIPTPLPVVKDRAMIAHFREHREEFEAVAQRFRSFPDRAREAGAATPQDETETKRLLERAGLRAYKSAYQSGWPYFPCGLWLPDPYHPDSRRKAQELEESCRNEVEQWYAAQRASKKFAKDFEADVPFPTCRLWNRLRYGAVAFVPSRETWRVPDFAHMEIEKQYLHFPEPPEIVVDPFYRRQILSCPYPENVRDLLVENSLNTFPLNQYTRGSRDWLQLNTCQYRPIEGEPHWFLEMCIANNTPGG